MFTYVIFSTNTLLALAESKTNTLLESTNIVTCRSVAELTNNSTMNCNLKSGDHIYLAKNVA